MLEIGTKVTVNQYWAGHTQREKDCYPGEIIRVDVNAYHIFYYGTDTYGNEINELAWFMNSCNAKGHYLKLKNEEGKQNEPDFGCYFVVAD